MGRRPYMNLIALGRSPFEPPEQEEVTSSHNPVYADGYVQEYDERGHPINSDSKARAKELRKAKNDVLSTMGIVVSGDDSGAVKEVKRLKLLAEENDTGLALATVDQIVAFVAKWWTSSLAARIQTFGEYAYVPLMDIIPMERNKLGFFSFYFAGLPVWTASFVISVCRSHFLAGSLEQIHSTLSSLFHKKWQKSAVRGLFKVISLSARTFLFLMIGQGYLFSLLQSLHVIPFSSCPRPRSLLPFTRTSIIQLPPLPSRLTPLEVGRFTCGILTSPFIMTYLYVNLRPVIETRIYRIIRRRLPKPDRPDNLSLRVAVENDILEWTVPWFGRRAAEEANRSQFTLSQEIKHEFVMLKGLVLRLLGYPQEPDNMIHHAADWLERYNAIQGHIDHLRHNFVTNTLRIPHHDIRVQGAPPTPFVARDEHNSHSGNQRPQSPSPGAGEVGQILVDEEHRFAQSPLPIREEYFPEQDDISRTAMEETERPGPHATSHNAQSNERERRSSLFTRPSSPETSPPTSPRVRASLVHQNSDVITMHLELLPGNGSNDNTIHHNGDNHNDDNIHGGGDDGGDDGGEDSTNSSSSNNNANTRVSIPDSTTHSPNSPDTIDRAASDILDAFLSNQSAPPDSDAFQAEPGAGQDSEMQDVDAAQDTQSVTESLEEVRAALTETVSASTRSQTRNSATERNPQTAHQMGTNADDSSSEATVPIPPLPSESDHVEHHVTILSSLPVDAFALHFSSVLASLLIYPVESLYLRYLASTFLSSPYMLAVLPGATASAVGLRASVMPLGTWFGGARGSGIATYIGKLVLVSGVDALVSTSTWAIATGIAIRLGKKRFGWGNL